MPILQFDGFYLTVTYILSAIVGLCVGSFLNVVIYRLPLGMSLSTPPSHCPKCDYRLRWYDNIPVLSYCVLGGKCRSCKTHISFRYTLVELSNALLWVACVWRFESNLLYAAIAAVAVSVSVCVFFIDLEQMLIFDRFQIILGVLGVAAIFLDKNYPWYSHLIGAAVGFLLFFGVAYLVGKLLDREALGGGDVKFAAVTGLFLGWEKLILMMLLSSVIGSVVMLALRKKNGESREIPFGPFLAGGFTVAMFFGDAILTWYLSLFA